MVLAMSLPGTWHGYKQPQSAIYPCVLGILLAMESLATFHLQTRSIMLYSVPSLSVGEVPNLHAYLADIAHT